MLQEVIEIQTDSLMIFEKGCLGCIRHNRHLMITLRELVKDEGKNYIEYDVFLDKEQAHKLLRQLKYLLEGEN